MRSGLASIWHTGVWTAFFHCSEAFIAGRTVARSKLNFPLFPGYVFVNIPRSERVRVLDVPGVLSFVGPKSEPAQLSDFEIETLRSGLHLQKFEPYRGLAIGRKVRINQGALQGLEGTLVRNAKSLRVVLTVDLIQQSVAVELDADAVELL